MFGGNDDHLALLFEFGLGRGGDGPWFRLLGDALESPALVLRNLLWWAVTPRLAGRGISSSSR
jgi:hypothetical protein